MRGPQLLSYSAPTLKAKLETLRKDLNLPRAKLRSFVLVSEPRRHCKGAAAGGRRVPLGWLRAGLRSAAQGPRNGPRQPPSPGFFADRGHARLFLPPPPRLGPAQDNPTVLLMTPAVLSARAALYGRLLASSSAWAAPPPTSAGWRSRWDGHTT
jgi:hypothetical protein